MTPRNTNQRINEMDHTAAAWVIHDHGVATNPERDLGNQTSKTPQKTSMEWVNASPDHAESYITAQSVWDELALLNCDDLRQPTLAANDTKHRSYNLARRALAVAAMVVITIIGGIKAPELMMRGFADHSTAHGEVTTIMLADGSQVLLDSASAIDVHFTETAREVRLISGRASFDVAPANDQVPTFIVVAGNSTTRALGTKFDVQFIEDGDDHDLTVTAIEHQIELTPDTHDSATSFILSPGEQVSIGSKKADSEIAHINLATSTSWQKGFLIFDHAKLSDVTTTLSRYSSGPILIASSDLAEREVSGMFRIDKIDQAVDFISEGLGASNYSIPHVATFLVD
ncbi:MAG: FecR domain-containing protein [Rhodospirillales bacterium]|nr:FecR domain-containing protein [Rhodospirillales bacterium]